MSDKIGEKKKCQGVFRYIQNNEPRTKKWKSVDLFKETYGIRSRRGRKKSQKYVSIYSEQEIKASGTRRKKNRRKKPAMFQEIAGHGSG